MHLYDEVKNRMDEGTIADCLTSQTISISEKNGWDALDVAYAVSSPFGAGIETVCLLSPIMTLGCWH